MIRVIITINPSESAYSSNKVASLDIWNDETGTEQSGNYCYRLERLSYDGRCEAKGEIKDWDRSQPIEKLVAEALRRAAIR